MSASRAEPELTRRAVAGSFILKLPGDWPVDKPQVALFKRSSKVRTYQQRYAPISGSVEKDDATPLDTAWREIREETTLTPTSLELIRQGKPYSFIDKSINREWTLNPFAFRLKPPSEGGRGEEGIQIDWEHDGWKWFDPLQVTDDEAFGGVPKLTESLRRSWFQYDLGHEVGAVLANGLDEMKNDHASGARQLAGKALETFIELLSVLPLETKQQWWNQVRMAAWHLWKNGRESMGAATLNVMLSALAMVEKHLAAFRDDSASSQLRDAVTQDLRDYGQARSSAVDGIWTSLEPLLREKLSGGPDRTQPPDSVKVLTLSSSSTIATCLEKAIREFHLPFDIRILESRPLCEGVSLASRLLGNIRRESSDSIQASVTVYTDASAAIAASGVDILLIGADLIGPDGAVSNKTGSLPAALAVKHVSPGAEVLVLAEKEKVLPFAPPSHPEENSPDEVLDTWSAIHGVANAANEIGDALLKQGGAAFQTASVAVDIKNIYFEWVPQPLVDRYVFEDCTRTSHDIANLSKDIKSRFDSFFSGL